MYFEAYRGLIVFRESESNTSRVSRCTEMSLMKTSKESEQYGVELAENKCDDQKFELVQRRITDPFSIQETLNARYVSGKYFSWNMKATTVVRVALRTHWVLKHGILSRANTQLPKN
jgi:hypothetical protein